MQHKIKATTGNSGYNMKKTLHVWNFLCQIK